MKAIPLLAVLMLAACVPARAADPVSFPDTAPGRHARAYFTAFAAGEAAMRAFWREHGSPAALAQRPIEPRIEVWRDMTGEFGRLTPVRVTARGADFVEVLARSEHGLHVSIRFLCEAAPPHGLMGLRVEDPEDEPPAAGAPPDSGPPPSDERIVAALAAEADSLAGAGAFSGTILLDKGGRALFEKAYGMASREDAVPNRLDTRFNLGSINKKFTETAIRQLARAGKLRLDDPIAGHLPDYPEENGRRITIQMLLDHRGGVPDVLQSPRVNEDPAKVRTQADWYAAVRDLPLDFEPGSKQAYSNGGFVLLGQIVASASGEDYYDYVRRHIYEPAGMTRSDHYAIGDEADGIASAYPRRGGPRAHHATGPGGPATIPGGHWFGRGSAAGGGYSTVGDLVRFTHALGDGRLLGERGPGEEEPVFGIAGGSPGVNGLLVVSGPYTLAVLANVDPPAAERFARTIGPMLRRAAGEKQDGRRKVVRVGGGAH